MKKIRYHIALFFFFFPSLITFSRSETNISPIKFKHLSVKDGLSRNWVKCIFQDSYGSMWFGTEDGLNKYDGYSFKIYKHNATQKNSLNHNNINYIYEDNAGDLWVGTHRGLNKYNRNLDEFVPIAAIENYVECALPLNNGKQLIGTDRGVFLFSPNNSVAKSLSSEMFVMDIELAPNNTCWLATDNGLFRADTSNYHFTPFQLPGNEESTAYKILQDSKGNLWVGTKRKGLICVEITEGNPQKPRVHQYLPDPKNTQSLSQGAIYALVEDNNKKLWIGIENGGLNILDINDLDKQDVNFQHYTHNSYDPASLSNNSIHEIYMDSQNTIWLGVYNGGLNYYNELSNQFSHVQENPENKNSLNNNHINVIYDEKDFLWIGTENGLNLWNKKTNSFQHFMHNYHDQNSIGSNSIWAICRDRKGQMWIGTWGGGLNLFNEETGTFKRFLFNENDSCSIGGNNIFGVIEDRDGYLWVASMLGGLNKFDPKTRKFTRYKHKQGTNSLPTDWVLEVYESTLGELWISTTEALTLLNRETGKFYVFKDDAQDNTSISYSTVNDIFEDSKQNIWLATNGGLNLFHRADSSFCCYTVSDGLPNNSVKAIAEDEQGNLWLTTTNGLSKFNGAIYLPENPHFTNYDLSDDLQGNEFKDRSICKGENGVIYIGGSNGYNAFHPERITENAFTPEITFTDFQVFNKSVAIGDANAPLQKHISMAEVVNLTRKHSVFTIEYAALNYISPEKTKYKYMLEGFDEAWNYVGSKRFATYTNLDPGKYIFKIKASNNENVWGKGCKALTINVLPAWWETNFAKAIYVILGLIALYFFRKYTIISTTVKNKLWLQHLESQKTQELNRLKFQFFTNISHELRTPLTLIEGPISRLLNKNVARKELRMVKNNVSRLVALVNQILDFQTLENNEMKLYLKEIDIVETLKNTFFNFNDLAEQKRINLEFYSSTKQLKAAFDEDKIQKIVTNITANAIKYTPAGGNVQINISTENTPSETETRLNISISDTGKGISKKNIDHIFDRFFTSNDVADRTVGTGIGLHLTKKLVELHGGTISVESKLGAGSNFQIQIPFERPVVLSDHAEHIVGNRHETENICTTHISDDKEYKVLIIDDNIEICNYIGEIVQEKYNIIIECNPLNGIDLILKYLPDIVISDVMMPELDGFELCKKIKTDIRLSHIPVILLTAKATTEDHITGFDLGADEYIYKPFNDELLLARIENLLRQREYLRNHFINNKGDIADGFKGNALDKEFMEKVLALIKQHYKDPKFSVNIVVNELGMSRSVFYKKLKALSNLTYVELLKNYRLQKAEELLKTNRYSISEIAYECGFSDPAYFSKVFKEHYRTSPKKYIHS